MRNKMTTSSILAILASGLFSFSGVLIETATNITFPTLMNEFHQTTSTVQWMTTGNLLMLGILIPISSYLKRRFSTKQLFMFASCVFLVGLFLDILAPVFWILLLGRIIQGIGVGIALPMMYNIILEETPPSMLGTMMGIASFVTAAAPALGPTFGGLMIQYYSWRYIFVAVVPVVLVALGLGFFFMNDHKGIQHEQLDMQGFVFIALTFLFLMLGFSNLDKIIDQWFEVSCYFGIGIIGLVCFIKRESNTKNVLIHLQVFNHKRFVYHTSGIFFLQMTTLGFGLLLPAFMQIVFKKSAMESGLVLLPGSVIGAICAPVGGILLDRLGAKKPILTGSLISFISVFGYFVFFEQLTYSLSLIFYTSYMFGLGLVMGNAITCALSHLPCDLQSDGNATLQTLQQLSGAIGTSISAAILAFVQLPTLLVETTSCGSFYVILFLMITSFLALCSQIFALREDK